jgi:hypothetical protein
MNKQNEIKYPEVNFTEGVARNTKRFLAFKVNLEGELSQLVTERESLDRSGKIKNTKEQKKLQKRLDVVNAELDQIKEEYNLTAIVSPDDGCRFLFNILQGWQDDYLTVKSEFVDRLEINAQSAIERQTGDVLKAWFYNVLKIRMQDTINERLEKDETIEKAVYVTLKLFQHINRRNMINSAQYANNSTNPIANVSKRIELAEMAQMVDGNSWDSFKWLIRQIENNWQNMAAWRMLNEQEKTE